MTKILNDPTMFVEIQLINFYIQDIYILLHNFRLLIILIMKILLKKWFLAISFSLQFEITI